MTIILKDIGRLWQLDEDGFLVNDASSEKIVPPYEAVVAVVKETYLKYARDSIHSIYLRGSIPRGLALEGVSDVDTFAITFGEPPALNLAQIKAESNAILESHPCITKAEFNFFPSAEVITPHRFSTQGFLIKTQAVCLYGENLAPQFPNYRPDKFVANDHLSQIKRDINRAIAEIKSSTDPQNTLYWCRRTMKSIIRSGFALVMLDERAYSKDIRLCYEFFIKYFPTQSNNMLRAVELAIEPSSDLVEVLSLLENLGGWLITKADEWLERYNPSREIALLLK
ncbi:MAG: hypothetical protein WCS37_09445 [Chloroflexota bacterium]|nr:hypothetical protein [Chloroflexota bacterium]